MKLITLTSDFGHDDGYVSVMKGVILEICPDAQIVEITNSIAAQNIQAAAWVLNNSYRYFPSGTIHLAVVDPGVGSERRPILLTGRDHAFIGPDNGIFSRVLNDPQSFRAYHLNRNEYFRPVVSKTFHGRDIFAPVAAHLACGEEPADLGQKISVDDLIRFRVSGATKIANQIIGTVVHIDHFGNLITNISEEHLDRASACRINGFEVPIGSTYSSTAPGEALALLGSHGCLEIGVNGARAEKAFSAAAGNEVVVQIG